MEIGSSFGEEESIGELLFDDYEDTETESSIGEEDVNKVSMDKFGWFYKVGRRYKNEKVNYRLT